MNGLLRSLDSNNDNQFNSSDAAYTQLRVWIDANANGITDAGELKTLAELGITSINLSATAQSGLINGGNEVIASGTFVQSGVTKQAQSVNFIANTAGHTFTATTDGVRIDTQATANAQATSTYTHTGVNNASLNATTLNVKNIYGNTGNDTITGDANANWLGGAQGADTINAGAGDDVILFDAQDVIDGGDGNDVAQVIGDAGVTLNLANSHIEAAQGGRGSDILIGGGRSSVFVRGDDGDDIVIGGAANDVLAGENGADLIDGGAGNDLIRGGRGRDQLLGGAGDDILEGGLDDDRLTGGTGNDVFTGGQGDDQIDGGLGSNLVEFSGSYADYRITKLNSTTYRVTDLLGRDGTDTLTNIQKISFKDVSWIDPDLASPLPVKDILDVNSSGIAITRTGIQLISKAQLLGNDIDRQNDVLHITAVSDSQGGTAIITAVGDVQFTPDANYKGIMGFKYSVADAANNSSEVTLNGATAAMKAAVYLRTPDIPIDPLVVDQWYLSEANIISVWKDYTGKGVKIAQFELGGAFAVNKEILDVTHSDLRPNLNQNWLADPNNPIPQTYSNHATLVAGVMVGARNGEGGIGVAYDASIAGYWLANGGNTPPDEFSSLGKMKDYDIANNSWGNDTRFVANTGGSYQEQIDGATLGRKGLGTIMVFGGGNDRASGGNANYNNLANSRYVIAVGAINAISDTGLLQVAQAPFSRPGSNILISAPGSNITSTSRLIEADNGSTFGADYITAQGTSFATPIISGIVALMLEANPNLGYRDVQEILALSAKDVNDPNIDKQYYTGVGSDTYAAHKYNGATNWNGGGMHFSSDFGFGEVDARAAVRLAETWKNQQTVVTESASALLASGNINLAIPDNNATGVSSSLTVSGTQLKIEHVEVTVNLTHANAGDIIIKLISPSGTQSFLAYRPGKAPGSDATNKGDATFNGSNTLNFTFDTVRDWGESANGVWRLQVIDAATGAIGTLNSWSLKLYGNTEADVNDQYIYTDEFTTLAATNVARRTLNDIDGGTDTLNAAAINGVVSVNLSTGTANLNGTALTISSPANIENAIGGEYNDTLTGNATTNRLFGGRGVDTIEGGAGEDILDGGSGADVLTGGTGTDYFIIRTGDAINIINDFVAGTDRLVLMGLDNVTVSFVQQGLDTSANLSNGQSVLLKNVSNLATIPANQTNSVLHVPDMPMINLYQSLFFGTDGNDSIFGSAIGDRIFGGNGNDVLVGDPTNTGPGGGDVVDGGAGNDEVIGGAGGDTLIGGAGADYVQGDAGNDTIYLEGDYLGDINVTNTNASVRGNAGADFFVLTQTTAGSLFTNFVWDFEAGTVGSPIDIIDLSQVAQATSFAKLNISSGNLGDPLGGFSPVTEIYIIGDPLGRVVTLYNLTAAQLRAENFVFAAAASTVINPTIAGGIGSDILIGDAGGNTLNGNTGADTMTGRIGGDTYIVDNVGDVINELPGGGYDAVQSSVTYTLSDNVEQLTLTDISNINGTGNAAANRLVGNGGNNILDGKAGSDNLVGGKGNDTYVVDVGTDRITENASEGTDSVQSSVTYTLGNNLESLTLTGTDSINATGNALINTLTGNAAGNVLDGAQGGDIMSGGAGSDTYFVDQAGDSILEALNQGIDTVYSAINFTLAIGSNIENLVLGIAANLATGNELDNQLTGNALNNTMLGNDGNDTLDGGAGIDTVTGGLGDDTYIVDLTATNTLQDTLAVGAIGDGIDKITLRGGTTLAAATTITLAAELENLDASATLATALLNLTGNASSNVLTGNAGANTLSGLDGNDTLDGGAGIDALTGGLGDDTYMVDLTATNTLQDTLAVGAVGDGIDKITLRGGTTLAAATTITLAAEIENLDASATLATVLLDLTGNLSANTLIGNAANNWLRGDAGDDSLIGGAGNDTLSGGLGSDTMNGGDGDDLYGTDVATDVIQADSSGNDTVNVNWASGTYTLAADLENINLGTGNINGTGNGLDNTINGASGNNSLFGGNGNDSLNGGAGNDTLDGGAGIDALTGGLGDDTYIVDLTATNTLQDTLAVGAIGDGIDKIRDRS